jgi:hypothetical protein
MSRASVGQVDTCFAETLLSARIRVKDERASTFPHRLPSIASHYDD